MVAIYILLIKIPYIISIFVITGQARRLSSGRSLQLSPTGADREMEEKSSSKSPVEHKIDLIDFGPEEGSVVTGTGSLNIEINNVGHQAKLEPSKSPVHITDPGQSLNDIGNRLNVEHNSDSTQNSRLPSSKHSKGNNAITKATGNGDNSNTESGDTFSFVDSLLEEAKSSRLTDSSNSEDSECTMTLPVGNQIHLPNSGAKLINKNTKSMDLTLRTRSQSSKQNAAAVEVASSFETISKQDKKQSQRTRTRPGQGRSRGDVSTGKANDSIGGSNQNSCLDVLDNSDSCDNTVMKRNKTEKILIDVGMHDCNRQTPSPSVLS